MNDHKAVQLIQRTARLAARAAVRDSLLVSLLYALAALLALLVLHPHLTPGAAWGVLGLLVLLPALRALRAHRRALGLRAAASRLDARFGLGDQLASALDFSTHPAPTALMRCHLAQAEARAAELAEQPLPRPARPALPTAPAVAMLLVGLTVTLAGDPGFGPDPITAPAPESETLAPASSASSAMTHRQPSRQVPLLAALLRQALTLPAPESEPLAGTAEETPPAPPPTPRATVRDRIATAQAEHAYRVAELMSDTQPELSFRATGKFDHGVNEMVAALDAEVLRGRDFKSSDLQDLASEVEDLSQRMGQLAAAREGRQSPNPMAMSRNGGFNHELQGLLRRSLSEFLENYASTLRAKAERLAKEEARHQRALVAAKGLTPPKTERTGLRSSQPPDGPTTLTQQRPPGKGFQSAAKPPPPGTKPMDAAGGGTSPGAEGAGAGQGPKAKGLARDLNRTDFEYLPVETRVGEGESEMELLAEAARGDLSAEAPAVFTALIDTVTREAADTLEREPIPDDLREVVQEYFRALRPADATPDG